MQLRDTCPVVQVQAKGIMLILGIPIPMDPEARAEVLRDQERLNEGRVRIIGARRADPEVKTGVFQVSSMAKAKYVGGHAQWSRDDMAVLDKQTDRLTQEALRLPTGFPEALLHGQWAMGLPRMSGAVALNKERSLGRFSLGPFASLGQFLLLNVSKMSSGPPPPGMAITVRSHAIHPAQWASTLVDEAQRVDLVLRVGGTRATPANEMISDVIEASGNDPGTQQRMRLTVLREGKVVMGHMVGANGEWVAPPGFGGLLEGRVPPLGQVWLRPGQFWAVDMASPRKR